MLLNTARIVCNAIFDEYAIDCDKDTFIFVDKKEYVECAGQKIYHPVEGTCKKIKEYIISNYKVDVFYRRVVTGKAGIIYQEMYKFADETKIFVTVDTRNTEYFAYQFYCGNGGSDTAGYHYVNVSGFVDIPVDKIDFTEFVER